MKEIFSIDAVEALLQWYRSHARELPWRKTKDPYAIWISEIMLQQTRVEAVKPYYDAFLSALPDVSSLAQVSEERLFKLWEGLGYYSRARNLKRAAECVMRDFNGEMPRTYRELLTLPGIGAYTAGAIASIAYGERVPAVDGNVLRVLSRYDGCFDDITKDTTKQTWRERLATSVPEAAGDFTQSLIELGATVCVPNGEARCFDCPLCESCVAARDGLCDSLPVRAGKKPRRIEERTVLLIRDGGRTALHKRAPKGLLAGLYELPNTEGHLEVDTLTAYIRSLGFEPLRVERLEDAKHIFSHIEWHMIGYLVRITPEFDGLHGKSGFELIPDAVLHEEYAIPSAFSAYTKYLSSIGRDSQKTKRGKGKP